MTPAGRGNHNQVRFDLDQVLITQTHFGHGVGPHVVDDDIAHGRQPLGQLDAFRLAQVEGKALLVPIDGIIAQPLVGRHLVGLRFPPGPHNGPADNIHSSVPFHFDHLGPEIGQHHGGIGTGPDPGKIQDPHSLQRKFQVL